jgi:hypothetical protein
MRTFLILLLLLTAGTSVLANPRRADRNSGQAMASATSSINCETVRSYVTLVGLVQARALARANGMTASQEWRARQCLSRRD